MRVKTGPQVAAVGAQAPKAQEPLPASYTATRKEIAKLKKDIARLEVDIKAVPDTERKANPLLGRHTVLTGERDALKANVETLTKHMGKLPKTGLDQVEEVVDQLHGAVDAQIAVYTKKNEAVPPGLQERKDAATKLLESAKSGQNLSGAEIAHELSALLWELNPAQLNQLYSSLEATAQDFGELAKMQHRFLPGLPVKMESIVDLLSGANKVPTSLAEVDKMMGDAKASLQKKPDAPTTARLENQLQALQAYGDRMRSGEAILRPLSLPPTQDGAHAAVAKLSEKLGELHTQVAALLADQQPAALTGDARAKFDKLSGEAVKLGNDLQTLESYVQQLDGYKEPSSLDRTGILFGVSLGPAWDFAKWIPNFPVPIFGGVGAGLHLFEKDSATGERKLDWYGAANLQTPFGGGGYAISPSKKGFSYGFNPPLGTKMGISLANHPFHGRKLDVFYPGIFRAEATSTGALALTLFAPVPIPGLKVGVTVLIRNPVLANVTGPILFVMDKGSEVIKKALVGIKNGVVAAWDFLTGKPAEAAAPQTPAVA